MGAQVSCLGHNVFSLLCTRAHNRFSVGTIAKFKPVGENLQLHSHHTVSYRLHGALLGNCWSVRFVIGELHAVLHIKCQGVATT